MVDGVLKQGSPIHGLSVNLPMRNLSMIHRPFGLIFRSDCRNQSIESSDNRQVTHRKHEIIPLLDLPSGSPNRIIIINRFLVIVDSATPNPSPIHHENSGI
jgi:hypothetical protein